MQCTLSQKEHHGPGTIPLVVAHWCAAWLQVYEIYKTDTVHYFLGLRLGEQRMHFESNDYLVREPQANITMHYALDIRHRVLCAKNKIAR